MSTSTELKNAVGQDEFWEIVDRRRAVRMDAVDSLSPELRALVHEYGYTVVKSFMELGVSRPKHIKHLVETVLNEFSPTRGSYARQGKRTEVGAHPAAEKLDE